MCCPQPLQAVHVVTVLSINWDEPQVQASGMKVN